MLPSAIGQYILDTFEDVEVLEKAPYTFYFNDPQQRFAFATIATGDEEGDQLSQLNREGVYRLNIGVEPETFKARFGEEEAHDYAALDRLMPHPVYASWSWVSVLNPSEATFESLKPLLEEAYELSKRRYVR